VFYNDSWEGIFAGAEAVVFVADSQRARHESNLEFARYLDENLIRAGKPTGLPYVLQMNKRDLNDLLSPEELKRDLGRGRPAHEACAAHGLGVVETFRDVVEQLGELEIAWDRFQPAMNWMPRGGVTVTTKPQRQFSWRRLLRRIMNPLA
jgi:signal recognition particle receptor subunit beta